MIRVLRANADDQFLKRVLEFIINIANTRKYLISQWHEVVDWDLFQAALYETVHHVLSLAHLAILKPQAD